jgi:hypothetical protein
MVQVAARATPRGYLVGRDGPLTVDDLEARVGFSAESFRLAIEVLSEQNIHWIDAVPWPLSSKASGSVGTNREASGSVGTEQDASGLQDPTGQDPTRQERTEQNKTGPDNDRAGVGFLPQVFAGSDRNGTGAETRFRNLFALEVAKAWGISPERIAHQRRPLLAVARRLEKRPDRDECLKQCVEIAAEKAGAGLDNPCAAWQVAVDDIFPAEVGA